MHHRFVNDPEFRASQLEHDRDEEVCIKMDELAQKDFRHHMTQAEYFRYRRNWWNSLNNDRTSGRLKNRSDFNEELFIVTPSTPRIWRTTTQVSAILEVSILAPIIEFFLQLVAMERFLVELLVTQTKVHIEFFLQLVAMERFLVELINNSNESPHMSDVQSDIIER